MEKLFLFLFISICFFSCKNADHLNINLSEYIPPNSSTVIKISDFELFQNDIEESDFFKLSFKKNSPKYNLDILKDLNISDQTLLCMTQDDDTTHLSIITKYHDSLVPKKFIDSSQFYNRIIDNRINVSHKQLIRNHCNFIGTEISAHSHVTEVSNGKIISRIGYIGVRDTCSDQRKKICVCTQAACDIG